MLEVLIRRLCPGKHHHPIDLIAEINAVVGGLAAFPQLWKTLLTRQVAGLEFTTFFLMFVTNVVWTIYGVHRRSLPVIISSVLTFVANGMLCLLIIIWK